MSVTFMGYVFKSKLYPTERFILLAYADHADGEGGNIYPSISTIAEKTGYSERTVQRVTAKLCHDKILVADGKGKKGTNKWRIDPDKLGGDTASGVTNDVPMGDNHDTGGDNDGMVGVTTTTKRGDKLCHPNHPLTQDLTTNEPSLTAITSLFGMKNDAAFETMLTTIQKIKFKNLWDTNPEKCVTIALYYANEGLTFQKTIGKIINNFDTWRDSKKQKPPEDYFAN